MGCVQSKPHNNVLSSIERLPTIKINIDGSKNIKKLLPTNYESTGVKDSKDLKDQKSN